MIYFSNAIQFYHKVSRIKKLSFHFFQWFKVWKFWFFDQYNWKIMHLRPRKQGRFIIFWRFPIGWVDEQQRNMNAHTHTPQTNIYIYIYIYIYMHCVFQVNVSEISSFFRTSNLTLPSSWDKISKEPYLDYQNCLYLYMCCFCIPFSCVPFAISYTMECNWTRCNHFLCKSSPSSSCILNSIAHQS